ncbi:hypothetical protein C6P45_003264 [Maudiozyma exigua]|uniref:Uncharacterized protein n=1 Tax=Maudiozyma exigua TaxID=34358 RepID=A0A9P6WC03_MAUEX|nr:hypothetical protein C6P45_003264 [Kazachstania exigua]
MMELEVESPLYVTVSSNTVTNLINNDLSIKVHRQTTFVRLLQYIHHRLSQLNEFYHDNSIEEISSYCIHYDGQEVPLEEQIQSVLTTENQSHIVISFELLSNRSRSAINLDYDGVYDFTFTNIKYEINLSSKYKFLHSIEYQVSLDTHISDTHDNALQHVIYEENFIGNDNKCQLGNQHSLDDLISMKFKVIELISNPKLFQKYMVVYNNTTINDVREFVSINYCESETISNYEVKLVYKGQLLRDTLDNNTPVTVMSCIDMNHGALLHVQVQEQLHGTTDSFWNEPEFIDDIPLQLNEPKDMSDILPIPRMDTPVYNVPPTEYITQSGEKIHIISDPMTSDLDLIEATLQHNNGELETVHIKRQSLKLSTPSNLFINGAVINIPIYRNNYVIDTNRNLIRIDPDIIQKIENETGTSIMYHDISNKLPFDEFITDPKLREHLSNIQEYLQGLDDLPIPLGGIAQPTFNELTLWLKIVHICKKIFQFIKVCSLTIFYLLWSMFIPLLAAIEIGFFLPPIITIPILIIYTITTIVRSSKIIDLSTDFLGLLKLNEEDYKRVKIFALPEYESLQTLRHEQPTTQTQMTKKVYERIQDKPTLFALFQLPALEVIRHSLYERYQINQMGNMTEEDSLKELFRQIKSGAVEITDANKMLEILFMLYELKAFSEGQQGKDFERVLSFIKNEADMDDLDAVEPVRRSFLIIRRRLAQLPDQIMEYIVPDPIRDDYIMAVFKNITLCLVLFLPFVSRNVDVVVQRRVDERTRIRLQRERDIEAEEAAAFDLSSANSSSTRMDNDSIADLDGTILEEVIPERDEINNSGELSQDDEDIQDEAAIEELLSNSDGKDVMVNATGSMFHQES